MDAIAKPDTRQEVRATIAAALAERQKIERRRAKPATATAATTDAPSPNG